MSATISHCYPTGSHSVVIHMSDGSIFYANGLGCGRSIGDLSWAPDSWTYPESGDEFGHKFSGEYTVHTPPENRSPLPA